MIRVSNFFKIMAVAIVLFVSTKNECSAQVKSYQKTSFGVSFNLEKGKMNIFLINDDLVEVKYTNLKELVDKQSLVVETKPSYLKNFSVAENKADIIITTAKLKITINRQTQAITYNDLSGTTILAEAVKNKSMTDTTVAGFKTYNCISSFKSPVGEGLFGLGCHPVDSLSIFFKFFCFTF